MATRRTTRATKGSTVTSTQPSISSHFRERRIGSSDVPTKNLNDAPSSTNSRAKRALYATVPKSEVVLNEVVYETAPVVQPKPAVRGAKKNLFGAETVKPKEEIKQDDVIVIEEPAPKAAVPEQVRSIIPTEAEVSKPKGPKKLRSIHDLNTALAEKSSGVRKLQEQDNANKLEKVADRVAFLKSPTKQIVTKITGGSPPKRARKEKKVSTKRGPIRVPPVPEFVLPSEKKTVVTVDDDKEKIEDEIEAEEDSMTRAPKGYGTSLMKAEVLSSARVRLPDHYKQLLDLFSYVDQVVSFFEANRKTCTLTELQTHVQKKIKQSLTKGRFAQLLYVFPGSYNVTLKQITCVGAGMGGSRAPRWEYIIKPNLDSDIHDYINGTLPSDCPSTAPPTPLKTPSKAPMLMSPMKGRSMTTSSGIRIPASPRKPSSPVKKVVAEREVHVDMRKRLEGWRLNCRYQVFRHLIAQKVIQEHDVYLRTVLKASPPSPSSSCLPMKFHPSFISAINSLCPMIPEATMQELPEEESAIKTGYHGMGDFIKKAEEIVVSLPKGVEAALNDLRSPEKKTVSSRGVPLSPAKFKEEQPKKMTLLEKIKMKEAERKLAETQRNPVLEAKMRDIDELLKKQLRTLFDVYHSSSRFSMDTTVLVEKMVFSSGNRHSKDALMSLVRRLCSLLPSHFTLNETSLGLFLKLADNSPDTHNKVERMLREELDKCRAEASTKRAP